jgi:hypothetical protein
MKLVRKYFTARNSESEKMYRTTWDDCKAENLADAMREADHVYMIDNRRSIERGSDAEILVAEVITDNGIDYLDILARRDIHDEFGWNHAEIMA